MPQPLIDKKYPYILDAFGKIACLRLNILHNVHHSASIEFIKNSIQLKRTERILEIGCGIGNMSFWFAETYGPKATVYGIDSSQEYIKICQETAYEKNLTNLNFLCHDLHENLDFKEKFDVIYSRYTLIHLRKIPLVLRRLNNLLKDGGVFICEEPTFGTEICFPFQKEYAKTRKLLNKISTVNGLDVKIGNKLKDLFSNNLDLSVFSIKFFQPILKNKYEKQLISLMLKDCKYQYINKGLISEWDFAGLSNKIDQFIEESENHLISLPRTTQICGIKSVS